MCGQVAPREESSRATDSSWVAFEIPALRQVPFPDCSWRHALRPASPRASANTANGIEVPHHRFGHHVEADAHMVFADELDDVTGVLGKICGVTAGNPDSLPLAWSSRQGVPYSSPRAPAIVSRAFSSRNSASSAAMYAPLREAPGSSGAIYFCWQSEDRLTRETNSPDAPAPRFDRPGCCATTRPTPSRSLPGHASPVSRLSQRSPSAPGLTSTTDQAQSMSR